MNQNDQPPNLGKLMCQPFKGTFVIEPDPRSKQLEAMRKVITSIYNSIEGYADGAPDASAHDKLCNEIASKLKPFITTP